MPRWALLVEFAVLYVGLPLGYRFSPVRLPALPVLWAVAGYALWRLLADPGFDRGKLWNAGQLPGRLGTILAVFAVGAVALWAGVRWAKPELEWSFVRAHPAFWAVALLVQSLLGAGALALGRPGRDTAHA